ncbi:RNA-directed DNA polymerase from mobile element jockey [Trichonephila clavipes]|nr:RNA-directed DNA polymerase from mobile element jockey [Trichonephila clavipes]
MLHPTTVLPLLQRRELPSPGLIASTTQAMTSSPRQAHLINLHARSQQLINHGSSRTVAFNFKVLCYNYKDYETTLRNFDNCQRLFHFVFFSKPVRSRNFYYVSDEIRNLMIERNRARKTWQFTRDPSDKRVLNNIQNRVHRKVKVFQNKIWEDELLALDPDDGSLWEMSKELRKKKSPVYALKGQAGIAHTDSDKAEVIACSLEKQFQENNITNSSDYIINRVVD